MDRKQQITQIVDVFLKRIANGEMVDTKMIQHAVDEHPNLAPDLNRELAGLVDVSRAFELAEHEPGDDSTVLFSGDPGPCPAGRQLRKYLNGELSPGERKIVELHVEQCPECADEVADRREVNRMVADYAKDPPPPDFELPGFEWTGKFLGRGGFGQVWLATDQELNRQCAVKILRPDLLSDSAARDLQHEAQIMSNLPKHRNRVDVYRLIQNDRGLFLVMEYVPGGSLESRAPLEWRTACRYIADAADALVDVHAAGILHRDVKPRNVLFNERNNEAVLCDWGAAVAAGESIKTLGTFGYMAPEQAAGFAVSKSDVFSLAATLFYLVTGRPPFDPKLKWKSIAEAQAGLASPVEALRHVPQMVEDVILAGLEPDADRRPELTGPAGFLSMLRGAHLESLGDSLQSLSLKGGARPVLNVTVSAESRQTRGFRPVNVERNRKGRATADVPELPAFAAVNTGDTVRFDVRSSADGWLTMLNLGSAGDLDVVFPNAAHRHARIRAGESLPITVQMTEPAGIDRAVFLWTREPGKLAPIEGTADGGRDAPCSEPPAQATRTMQLLLEQATQIPGRDWSATVVAISHESRERTVRGGSAPPAGVRTRGGPPGAKTREIAPVATAVEDRVLPDRVTPVGDVEKQFRFDRDRRVMPVKGRPAVNCMVYAPPSVPVKETATVQVYAAAPEDAGVVEDLAKRQDAATEQRGTFGLETEIEQGANLGVHLHAPGFDVSTPWQSLRWEGRPNRYEFAVAARPAPRTGGDLATATFCRGTVPIGCIQFRLGVIDPEDAGKRFRAAPTGDWAGNFRTAYVCSAPKDAEFASRCAGMLESAGVDVAREALNLDPGARWERRLYERIDKADLFVLAWSAAAADSPWLLEEVRYALSRRREDGSGPPVVLPVRVDGEPAPDPPSEFAWLPFDDQSEFFASGSSRLS